MKKVFGIVLALALVLTTVLVSAVPAAAVFPGTVEVCLSNPIAKEFSHYCIKFWNGSLLKASDGDYIDLMFPYGTNTTSCDEVTVQVSYGEPDLTPSPCGPCVCPYPSTWVSCPEQPPVWTVNSSIQTHPGLLDYIRVYLEPGGDIDVIDKYMWVLITTCNITNPCSCEHFLEVGTSTHTPVDSEPYTIYCAKIGLVGGFMPNGMQKMNLISIPCYPTDKSIESVFWNLFLQAELDDEFSFSIWTYDTCEAKWYKYVSDTSFDEIDTIDVCKSYWIKVSEKITIFIHGAPYPPGQGPPLKCCYCPSWNMVGFVSLNNMPASSYLYYTLLAPLFDRYCVIAIWDWNEGATIQHYAPTLWNGSYPAAPDVTLLKYQGYWMAFLAECCIIPPPQAGC